MRKNITLLSMMVAALAAACSTSPPNISGDVASKGTGDLSNPPVERRPFDAEVVAACGPGAVVSPDVGRQPYLQLVGTNTATVVWTSLGEGPRTVEVTTPAGEPVTTAEARVDQTANPVDGGRQLYATLASLSPDTMYCYRLMSDVPMTERIGFKTAPAAGMGAAVDILVFGDSGDGGADQQTVLDQMVNVPFDLILHVGDIAYDTGTRQEMDDFVFAMYADLLKHVPIYPAIGNHEVDTEDGLPWREAFMMPENGGAGAYERWYSFDYGDAHFTVVDTERVNAQQAAWIDADLAATNQAWKIVVLHRPPFTSGDHGSDMKVREVFSPIFEKHKVPLVLQGHDHNYERTRPQNGVIYVTSGGGGHGTVDVGRSSFTAYSEAVLQFVQLRVTAESLTLHAVDAVGKEFDSLVLERPSR